MTKSEMVKRLAETWGGLSNRQANDQLDQLVEFITKTVKKDKELKIPNLGTFRLRQLKARTGRNPQTVSRSRSPRARKSASRRRKYLRKRSSALRRSKRAPHAGGRGEGQFPSLRPPFCLSHFIILARSFCPIPSP